MGNVIFGGNVPIMSVTMTPIKMNTPMLRYHIPARVESGQRGCMVSATAPTTANRTKEASS